VPAGGDFGIIRARVPIDLSGGSSMSKVQNFGNHARFFPPFHFFVAPVLLINVIRCIVQAVRAFSIGTAFAVLVALALLVLAFVSRIMVLAIQDRVIRLEMRLRMQQILPADLRGRIPEFSVSQLVALRFAGDAELPELARKVLQENLTNRSAIKKMVRNWQPDFLRA
jgi:hypothetical protein